MPLKHTEVCPDSRKAYGAGPSLGLAAREKHPRVGDGKSSWSDRCWWCAGISSSLGDAGGDERPCAVAMAMASMAMMVAKDVAVLLTIVRQAYSIHEKWSVTGERNNEKDVSHD